MRDELGFPLETASHPQTILAYAMNGEPLTKEHGFPARILMSGRFGMKNPKWVTAILQPITLATSCLSSWTCRGR